MKFYPYLGIVILILTLTGCDTTKEFTKTVWGSSTRVLEEARGNAITKTYDKGYWDCFRAALHVVEKKNFTMFQKDEIRGFMVVMGIPGAVNTTEVGVFFVELNDHQARIEISSLSTNAKRLLAKSLFHGMDIVFGIIPPDKQPSVNKKQFEDALLKDENAYDQLIKLGLLEQSSAGEALLKKDPNQMREDLIKAFPDDFDKIWSILQKAQQDVENTSTSIADTKK